AVDAELEADVADVAGDGLDDEPEEQRLADVAGGRPRLLAPSGHPGAHRGRDDALPLDEEPVAVRELAPVAERRRLPDGRDLGGARHPRLDGERREVVPLDAPDARTAGGRWRLDERAARRGDRWRDDEAGPDGQLGRGGEGQD